MTFFLKNTQNSECTRHFWVPNPKILCKNGYFWIFLLIRGLKSTFVTQNRYILQIFNDITSEKFIWHVKTGVSCRNWPGKVQFLSKKGTFPWKCHFLRPISSKVGSFYILTFIFLLLHRDYNPSKRLGSFLIMHPVKIDLGRSDFVPKNVLSLKMSY